jgi:hypothetical protein
LVALVGIPRPKSARVGVEVSGARYSSVQNPGTAVFRPHTPQRQHDKTAPEPGT